MTFILEPPKKLYIPSWSCPICDSVLGEDAGVIPAVIATCRPVAHTICLDCFDKMKQSSPNSMRCPLDNELCGDAIPLVRFVRDDIDLAAKIRLDDVKAAKPLSTQAVVDHGQNLFSSHMAKLIREKTRLLRERLVTVHNEVHKQVLDVKTLSRHVTGHFSIFWTEVPDFDKNNVELVNNSRSAKDIALELRAMAAELQPDLDRMLAGSDLVVKYDPDQSIKDGRSKRFVYLKFNVDVTKYIEKSGGRIMRLDTSLSSTRKRPQKRKIHAKKKARIVHGSQQSEALPVPEQPAVQTSRVVQQRQAAANAVQNMNLSSQLNDNDDGEEEFEEEDDDDAGGGSHNDDDDDLYDEEDEDDD